MHTNRLTFLQGADGQGCREAAKQGQRALSFSKTEAEPQSVRFRGPHAIYDILFPWREDFFPCSGWFVFLDGTTQSRRCPRSSFCSYTYLKFDVKESKTRVITRTCYTVVRSSIQPQPIPTPSFHSLATNLAAHTCTFIIAPLFYWATPPPSLNISDSSPAAQVWKVVNQVWEELTSGIQYHNFFSATLVLFVRGYKC